MFMYLSLPIPLRNKEGKKNGPVTVFECLQAFLAPEKLSGDDQWKCPKCKVKRDASKTLAIVKLPTVLLIHFKRFSFNGPFRDKLETAVDFPVRELNLAGYTKISDQEDQSYSLCGVSV
jgi:ubiquitin carboxyl-terminal hydrolase 8